jgi:radical SAM superfamily enzyme YgiQ (UPF0313 family)
MKCLLFNVVYENLETHSLPQRSLGIYKIAHLLRSQNWDVEVIDYATLWKIDQLKELAKSRITVDTKFIGFSKLFDMWTPLMETFAGWLKETYPWLVLISGSQYHKGYTSKHIEYYISGYAETALTHLLKYLFSNGPAPKFSLLSNSERKIIDANTFYPSTSADDLFVDYEDRDFINSNEWLAIEFSRGCKFACGFCDFPFLNIKGDPSRSQEDFEKQVKDAYNRFGIQKYTISDSTFNDRTEKITKFADVVERLDFDIHFSGYIRADLIISRPQDREELSRMKFRGHFYGIESFNAETAKCIGKGMHPDKIKQGLLEVKKYFQTTGNKRYNGQISLIAGLPYETPESLKSGLQWIEDNWIAQPYTLSPYMLLVDGEKSSKISREYEEYGYESMENDLEPEFANKVKKVLRDSGNTLMWKNPYMNIIQAYQLCQEFDDRNIKQCHPGVFGLSNIMYNRLTLDQTLNLTNGAPLVIETEEQDLFINTYINKKLSI